MKFKEMELNNFRQFKDIVKINFSTDSEKNVTVIIGDNGAGKTTLLQAFNWCLYDKLTGLENPNNLLNDDTLAGMNIGDTCEASVSIVFEHCGKTYYCKNAREYQKVGENTSKIIATTQSYSKTELDGQTYKVDQNEINSIFPKDLSRYFLFDGERLVQLGENKTKGKKDLANAVTNLLGLDVLKNTNEHLAKVKKSFENEYVSDHSERLEEIKESLDKADSEIENEKKKIASLESENEYLEDEISELDEKLKSFEKLKNLQAKRNEYNDQRDQNAREIEDVKKRIFSSFGESMPFFFMNTSIRDLQEKIKNANLNEKSIQGIHGDAVNELLKRGTCICGCDLNNNEQARETLIDLLNYILPNDYGAVLKGLESDLNNKLEQNTNFYENFEHTYKEYNKYIEKQIKLDDLISDNEEKINKIGDTNLNKYNEDYKEKRRQNTENVQAIGECRGIIKTKEAEILRLKEERSKLTVSNNINEQIRKKVDVCDSLIYEISKRLKKNELEVKKNMQRHASKLLSEMLNSNKTIEILDDYSFVVYDEFNNTVLSEGERIVVSFAFVSALISVAKENLIYKEDESKNDDIAEDKVFTLVMDAPFAKLDINNSEGVSTIIPKLTDQIILFTVNKQWEGKIQECLQDRVGVMYEMQKDKSTSGVTRINKMED